MNFSSWTAHDFLGRPAVSFGCSSFGLHISSEGHFFSSETSSAAPAWAAATYYCLAAWCCTWPHGMRMFGGWKARDCLEWAEELECMGMASEVHDSHPCQLLINFPPFWMIFAWFPPFLIIQLKNTNMVKIHNYTQINQLNASKIISKLRLKSDWSLPPNLNIASP